MHGNDGTPDCHTFSVHSLQMAILRPNDERVRNIAVRYETRQLPSAEAQEQSEGADTPHVA